MKNSLACPKCESRKPWKVEGPAAKDRSAEIGGAYPLMVAVGRNTLPTKEASVWTGDGSTVYDAGIIDAWVCTKCGYTEFWSHSFEQLVHNPAAGVHLVDTTPQQGEYR